MIKINKSSVIPAILSGRGVIETNKLNTEYLANPSIYTSATGVSNRSLTPMLFDNKIYGDQSVKEILITDQHEKCCFCESKFLNTSHGDVEHFRPKKAYKKFNVVSLTYPGYYWLAYKWENLLFSCEKCNRSYKRSLFPLLNESTRKPYHSHPNLLEQEDSLLINPITEDPAVYITFKEEIPVSIADNLKGKESIKVFNLERLNNSRFEHLQMLEIVLAFTQIDMNNVDQMILAVDVLKITDQEIIDKINAANILYNNVAKDSAKFAHCVRSKFPNLPTI